MSGIPLKTDVLCRIPKYVLYGSYTLDDTDTETQTRDEEALRQESVSEPVSVTSSRKLHNSSSHNFNKLEHHSSHMWRTNQCISY